MINLHYDVDSPLGPPFGGKARYKYNKQTKWQKLQWEGKGRKVCFHKCHDNIFLSVVLHNVIR